MTAMSKCPTPTRFIRGSPSVEGKGDTPGWLGQSLVAMNNTIARGSVALAAILFFTCCADIPRAPAGSPRVELEVQIKLDDSYTGQLRGAGPELLEAVADVVLAKADVGLRFYPVLSQNYGRQDPRPDYVMTVEVRELEIGYGHRTLSKKGEEPVLETFVDKLDCSVSATITKRRKQGPSLTVGHFDGEGSTTVVAHEGQAHGDSHSYEVKRDEDKSALTVARSDLLRATDRGLGKALKGLITPVDRELSFRNQAEQPASPQ